MDTQRTGGQPGDKLSVIVVDENLWHANTARHMLSKHGFQGIEGNPHNACCLGYENSAYECGDGIKQKTNLMWTPYLESKFVCALDLLGEGATPKKIQMVMNIKSIKRKNISTHLQKHRKKIEKKLCNKNRKMRNRDSSSSQPLRTCETSPNTLESDDTNMEPIVITDNEMTSDQTESFTEETEGNKIYYEAMQRALRLGAVFDELQHCNDQTESYTEVIDHTFGGINVVVSEESLNTVDDAREVMSKVTNSYEQVSDDSGETGVVKLVAYSDSEDDEIDP
nr:unnamed protein product [Digitaria exilis]